MEFVVLIWCASGSTARTKSKPERGHPCLTPLCKEKNSDECPLLMTQLENNIAVECSNPVEEAWAKVHNIEHLKKVVPL